MLSGPELTGIGAFLEEEGMDIFNSVAVLGDCIWSYINLEHLSHTEPGPPPARLEVQDRQCAIPCLNSKIHYGSSLSLLPHDQSHSSDLQQRIKGDCGIQWNEDRIPLFFLNIFPTLLWPIAKTVEHSVKQFHHPRHLPISHARTLKFIWNFICDRNLHFLGYLCIFAHLPINYFPSWERSCNISPEWLCPLQAEHFKVSWRCEYLLASSGTHSHTLALERVFHQNYKLRQPWSFEVERTKLNHCMPRVDWLGLTWILGAKPDPLH